MSQRLCRTLWTPTCSWYAMQRLETNCRCMIAVKGSTMRSCGLDFLVRTICPSWWYRRGTLAGLLSAAVPSQNPRSISGTFAGRMSSVEQGSRLMFTVREARLEERRRSKDWKLFFLALMVLLFMAYFAFLPFTRDYALDKRVFKAAFHPKRSFMTSMSADSSLAFM